MKLDNYLPKLAKSFPDLYIVGAEKIIEKIKNNLLEHTTVASASRKLRVPESTLRDFLNSNSLPSIGRIDKIQKFIKVDFWDEI